MQGHLDSPLTELGRAQVDAHGKALKANAGIGQLIVSPSGRTRETVYILNSYVRAPLRFEDSLLERDCGDWTGRTLTEIETDYPQAWKARTEDGYHHRPPGGENHEDMLQRVKVLLDTLPDSEVEEIGLVTHGVMSRVIISHFLGLAPNGCTRVCPPNDLFYRLQFSPGEIQTRTVRRGPGVPPESLGRSEISTRRTSRRN